MKKIYIAFAVVLFLFSVFVTQSFAAQDQQRATRIDPSRTQMGRQMTGAERVSQMMNKNVMDTHGQRLGRIEDVVVSETGGANYVILSGADNKLYPIPMTSIQQGSQRGQFIASITRDQLRNAPSFTRNNWPDLSGTQWEQRIFSYYVESPQGMGTMSPHSGMEQGMRPGMERDMNRGAQPGMGHGGNR